MTGKDLIKLIKDLGIEEWELDFEMTDVISLNNPDHVWGEIPGSTHSIDISPFGYRLYIFEGINEDGDVIYDWEKFEEAQK